MKSTWLFCVKEERNSGSPHCSLSHSTLICYYLRCFPAAVNFLNSQHINTFCRYVYGVAVGRRRHLLPVNRININCLYRAINRHLAPVNHKVYTVSVQCFHTCGVIICKFINTVSVAIGININPCLFLSTCSFNNRHAWKGRSYSVRHTA